MWDYYYASATPGTPVAPPAPPAPPSGLVLVGTATGANSGTGVGVTVSDIPDLEDGDELWAVVVTYDAGEDSWTSSGWSSEDSHTVVTSPNYISDLMHKTASSESGTWTFSQGNTGAKVAIVAAFRNASSTLHATAGYSDGLDDLTPTCATVACTGDAIVMTMMVGVGSSIAWSAGGVPSGWSDLDADYVAGTGAAMASVAFFEQTGSGTPSAAAWTHSTDDSTTDYTLRAIAIEAA